MTDAIDPKSSRARILELEGKVRELYHVARAASAVYESRYDDHDSDAMVELGEALSKLPVEDREQPNPPLWQQSVVRDKGMCGALVTGMDGQDAICILDRGHGRGVHAWYPSGQQPI
jgi:hypothetical protein